MARQSRLIILIGMMLLTTPLYAATPTKFTVQGRLTDSSGAPLPAGDKSFSFRIFGTAVGGTKHWPAGAGEVHSLSTDNDGLWTAQVGSLLPIQSTFLSDTSRWLEIEVDGTVLPRVQLMSSPYAMRIQSVDDAQGGEVISNVAIGSGVNVTGTTSFGVGSSVTVDGNYASVTGGQNNSAENLYASVGGGFGNEASGVGARIGGGTAHVASGTYSHIGGGDGNDATNENASVLGGYENTASGSGASVGGGGHNVASGINSVVGGGGGLSFEPLAGNSATGDYSTVSGGRDNDASGFLSTVGGGWNNSAGGIAGSVLGGEDNFAVGDSATVAGGSNNFAGGRGSAIGGGDQNDANGIFATVPGGRNNAADGNFSFAAGRRAEADHNGSFVWADNNDVVFHSSGPNQFLVRAEGGVCLGDSVPSAMLHVTNNGPNSIALYLEGGARDIAWGTGQILQIGQWDGAAFTERMRINSGGNVGINTTTTPNILTLPDIAGVDGRGLANAWNVYSSRRWKDSIETITGALDKVSRLRGVSYVHKSDRTPDIGLIAEEVGEVIPEVVQYEANGLDAQSVDYARLVALLIEAVKQQQAQIVEQGQEIANLKRAIQP